MYCILHVLLLLFSKSGLFYEDLKVMYEYVMRADCKSLTSVFVCSICKDVGDERN
jgi:hypothetical protein